MSNIKYCYTEEMASDEVILGSGERLHYVHEDVYIDLVKIESIDEHMTM